MFHNFPWFSNIFKHFHVLLFWMATQTVESGHPGVWPWSPTKSFVPKAFAGRKRWELSKSLSCFLDLQRTISWCSICLVWGNSRGVVKQNLAKLRTLQVRFWPHDLQNRVPDTGGWHPWTTAVCLCGTSHGAASQGPDAPCVMKTPRRMMMFFFLFDGCTSKGIRNSYHFNMRWDST